MSDDKQLTVAELLARAQQDRPDEATPRQRRRRSLDEGGVSVAELTGSLKKVDARPLESRHSSVPIDAPGVSVVNVGDPEEVEPPTTSWTIYKNPDLTGDTETSVSDPQTDQMQSVERDDVPSAASTGELPAVDATDTQTVLDDHAELEDPSEMDSINPILLVLFVFIGLVAGVAGFFAFQWAWANLPLAAAIIAALVATVAIVVGVRLLRTGKDGLTMALAGIAGLVVTFGPGLISGF